MSKDVRLQPGVIEPIRLEATVRRSREDAFTHFTGRMTVWWPMQRFTFGPGRSHEVLMEPFVGGRFYERYTDGEEFTIGEVLAWEPPKRVVLAWQISPQWKFEPDLAKASEVEISFTSIPGGETRVDLNHHHWERHGAGVEQMYASVGGDMGWNGLLSLFAAEAEKVAV